jgi:hypothetical protein
LRNIEAVLNSSLARDQMQEGKTHMRGGEIGIWRDEYDIEFARGHLGNYGISFNEFIMA